MEEDVLFGKHRHLFGGIAPSNMLAFTAKANKDNSTVTITAKLPKDTIIDNQMVCCVGGVVIRTSTSDYPKDEFDGELVADISEDSELNVAISGEEIIYFSAFPYSKQGVYNRNKTNRTRVDCRRLYGYLFGYDLTVATKDPTTRVTYPDDVDNAGFKAAYMDFDTSTFDYGDWNFAAGEKFMPRPCMLKYDGTVAHYLDPNDYTKKDDGVSNSSVQGSSFGGNAMMEWPKIYTKRWEENGVYHFRCSDTKIDDDYECWCNYDANNNEIDHFYTAIFRSATVSSRSRSYSGAGAYRELSMSTERTYAQKNGTGWDLEILADHLLIQDLLVLMAKTTDTQTAYGVGRSSNVFVVTGGANASGLFSGANDSSKSVKVFGMEDWWGDLSRRLLGLTVYSGKLYAKITKGTKDGSTINDYIIDSVSGYLGCGNARTETAYGYISKMATYPWGRLPSAFNGSASTYECDYGRIDYNTHSYMPAEIGGSYEVQNPYKGAFGCRFSYTAASSPAWMTSRLSYKPTAT